MKNVMIFGATSAIAESVARRYAQNKDNLYLLARDQVRLEAIAKDLRVRGASKVECRAFNATEVASHEDTINKLATEIGKIDVVLVAHGVLPDQAKSETDTELALNELQINAISAIALLLPLANIMQAQQAGTLAVITSVAGDRGRQSNYLYGCAKGMLSIFLEGLNARLATNNVHVLDIKPGFVDTPMTQAFDKGLLWAKPDKVAADIVKAIQNGKSVIYTPFFWRYIMLTIKLIPRFIFKKLKV